MRLLKFTIVIINMILSASYMIRSKLPTNRLSSFKMVSTVNSGQISTKRLQEFQNLVQDISKIALQTGVKTSVIRSLQFAQASAKITREFISNPDSYLTSDRLPNVPKLLRRYFEELGATYIKLGQFIASSPTLFPPDYVREFQNCLDKSTTVPFSVVKNIIQEDFKKSPSELFASIDPVPIASASIAQVHKAKLRDGTTVCIKIQKPGVDTTLIADLNFLSIITKILEFIDPSLTRLSLSNIVSDIRDSMFEELDFRKESDNLMNFRDFLRRNNIEDAVAPEPYLKYCSKRVLTMEYLQGVPLIDLEGIKKYSANPEATLVSALRTWGLSVTNNDRFHADVHGGNLLVLEDGRIGFIDFGIVARIPDRVWTSLSGVIEGLIENDFKRVASSMVTLGATDTNIDIDKFANELQSVFDKITNIQPNIRIDTVTDGYGSASVSAQLSIDEKETTELVLELVSVTDKNGLKLPREFGFLLKQALYFDRYQKLLAPNIDPLRDVRVRDSFKSFSQESGSSGGGGSGGGNRRLIDNIIDAEIVS